MVMLLQKPHWPVPSGMPRLRGNHENIRREVKTRVSGLDLWGAISMSLLTRLRNTNQPFQLDLGRSRCKFCSRIQFTDLTSFKKHLQDFSTGLARIQWNDQRYGL
jgi:hypothetical protein